MGVAKGVQPAGQQELADRVAGGQRQGGHVGRAVLAQGALGVAERGERRLGVGIEDTGGRGGPQPEPTSVEQRHAGPAFQRVQSLAHRRRGEPQGVGRAVHAAGLHGEDERDQVGRGQGVGSGQRHTHCVQNGNERVEI